MQELVFQKLTELNIPYITYEHEAFFTCEQAARGALLIPAAQCKNLFLKDNKKNLYLVVAIMETVINLKKLSSHLGAPELRFANAELLQHYLHVAPGSVTPFGLLFDTEHTITVILDAELFNHAYIGFHPLRNTATTVIASKDLISFIEACKNRYHVINFHNI